MPNTAKWSIIDETVLHTKLIKYDKNQIRFFHAKSWLNQLILMFCNVISWKNVLLRVLALFARCKSCQISLKRAVKMRFSCYVLGTYCKCHLELQLRQESGIRYSQRLQIDCGALFKLKSRVCRVFLHLWKLILIFWHIRNCWNFAQHFLYDTKSICVSCGGS